MSESKKKHENCPSCNEVGTLTETAEGDLCCRACGLVVEAKDNVVSELRFVEGSFGTHHTMGQMVGMSGSVRSRNPGFRQDSRSTTIENGRKRIAHLANRFHLTNHHIESAVRLFRVAVEHNFTQGRRSETVVASCLYIVCRRESMHLLLVDFADELSIDVYSLGQTFLQFSKLCDIELKPIDPSLYLHRFARELQFEEKTQAVTNAALKLIQRMNRDWIQTGRRPSGICGATLLIAARMHGFHRSIEQVIKVVRVCDMTLRRRLDEFKKTPTSGLTIEEFEDRDVTPVVICDPPAYTKNRESEDSDKEEPEELGSDWKFPDLGEADRLDDIPDEDIAEYFTTSEEQKLKTEIWEEVHRDYLLEQKRKQDQKVKEEMIRQQRKLEREASLQTKISSKDLTKSFITNRLNKSERFFKSRKVELKEEWP